ncbi:hypothetical protein L6452_34228 [Arctium lappa]|uniref:Uncharacterized protein n=1 Tax=Arctium lappa TaxID=4217 RepID=A0ACB8YH08_ARCLA|nr:hypothetical protein L6452_34228 [Arctium lappa]
MKKEEEGGDGYELSTLPIIISHKHRPPFLPSFCDSSSFFSSTVVVYFRRLRSPLPIENRHSQPSNFLTILLIFLQMF